MRARYYDPSTGRFLSKDTAALNAQNPLELNRYGYTADNPVNYTDPSGHQILADYSTQTADSQRSAATTSGAVAGFTSSTFLVLATALNLCGAYRFKLNEAVGFIAASTIEGAWFGFGASLLAGAPPIVSAVVIDGSLLAGGLSIFQPSDQDISTGCRTASVASGFAAGGAVFKVFEPVSSVGLGGSSGDYAGTNGASDGNVGIDPGGTTALSDGSTGSTSVGLLGSGGGSSGSSGSVGVPGDSGVSSPPQLGAGGSDTTRDTSGTPNDNNNGGNNDNQGSYPGFGPCGFIVCYSDAVEAWLKPYQTTTENGIPSYRTPDQAIIQELERGTQSGKKLPGAQIPVYANLPEVYKEALRQNLAASIGKTLRSQIKNGRFVSIKDQLGLARYRFLIRPDFSTEYKILKTALSETGSLEASGLLQGTIDDTLTKLSW